MKKEKIKRGLQTIKELVGEIKRDRPTLSDDSAFLSWFINACLVDKENQAVASLTGNGDKSIDAIVVDSKTKNVFLIQGKYHTKINLPNESRSDIISFANLAGIFRDKEQYKTFLEDVNAKVKAKLPLAFKRVIKDNFRLNLYYVTTGKISDKNIKDAKSILRSNVGFDVRFVPYDFHRLLYLLNDYLEGVAPPIPAVDLPLKKNEILHRYDQRTAIDSWIFTMKAKDLGRLFDQAGIRLFARNIRGYLGDTAINKDMQKTLEKEPHHFWYFNNGVTFVCDNAEKHDTEDKSFLSVYNPQIINGQQTTRVLAEAANKNAEILVRVMAIKRDLEGGEKQFSHMIESVVKATNWQNAITPADLRSNDKIQVKLQKDFRKYKVNYLRKRQAKSEVARLSYGETDYAIKKEEVAKATYASLFDPAIVRLGINKLFGDKYYSQIFSEKRSPLSYLTFYWLDRTVRSQSRGKAERGYERWPVLHQLWNELDDFFDNKEIQHKFVHAIVRKDRNNIKNNIYQPLCTAIDNMFRSTQEFFNICNKVEGNTLDENLLFKRHGVYRELASYLASDKNKRRTKIEEKLNDFRGGIEKLQVVP